MGGGKMNGKVVYLRQEDRPIRSVLIPQPRKRWHWNWRRATKNLLITAGLVVVWLMVLEVVAK